MRKTAVVVLFLVLAAPAYAARRVTVKELNQALATMDRKSDADMAWHIADLELGERLNGTEFSRLASTLPGEASKQALRAVFDESQFLDPPVAETPNKPAPTLAEQRRIMGLVVNYVSKIIPQLPNFIATRTTLHFEDTPQLQRVVGTTVAYRPLHEVRRDVATVSYRDGREVVAALSKASGDEFTKGLKTEGIFGAFLGRVLVDAAQSSLRWGRWEAGAQNLAVFDFAVPQLKSHYEVDYCCVTSQTATAVAAARPFRKVVSYRGEMVIDPATGTILRLLVIADLDKIEPITRSAILVDYGTVEIGGRKYICPTNSLTLLTGQTFQIDPNFGFALANQVQPIQTVLDDVTFSQYHIFRAEARIMSAENTHNEPNPDSIPKLTKGTEKPAEGTKRLPEESDSTGNIQVTGEAKASSGARQIEKAAATEAGLGEGVTTPGGTTAEVAKPSARHAQGAGGEPPETPLTQRTEMSLEGASSLPANPAIEPDNELRTRLTLRTTTRLVEVGVVALDKKGSPVTDLKAEDIEILDNGVKQKVRFFSRAGELALNDGAAHEEESRTSAMAAISNRAPHAEDGAQSERSFQGNSTILLIDASHLAFGDLTHAREEMLRFLNGLAAGERLGLYILRSNGFQVLQEPTADIAAIRIRLKGWMPDAQDLARAQNEQMRNRHQMEYVDTLQDLFAVNGSTPQGHTAILQPSDPNLRANGDEPGRDTLVLFPVLARHLAAIDGHKALIWVASDNVLADWSDSGPRYDIGNKQLGPLLMQAQESMNEAHVSIYPLDASQLEAGGVGADLLNANVQMNPGAPPPIAQEAGMTGSEQQEAEEQLNRSKKNMYGGRATETMKQDLHPISAEYRELAEATGGRALRRAGDIAGELKGILAEGRAAYLLGFTPSLPADGTYHAITLKVKGHDGVKLRYRSGYLAAREPESLKARFQDAIWSPRDALGIGLRATPSEDGQGGVIKLNIAGTDLDLEQRGGRWIDRLDIFVVERNLEGLTAKLSGQTLGLRLLPGTYQKAMADGIDFEQHLDSRPENADVRILVVDENSWRIGTVTIPPEYWASRKVK